MKNDHLVPASVQDIVWRLQDSNVSPNEKLVLLQRLEAIRDYCDKQHKKHNFVDSGQKYGKR